MKNIIKSLIVVIAVAAVAGGATYAYFSSTATMSGVTFSTGTMNLKIDDNVIGSEQHWVDGFNISDNNVANHDFRATNGWTGSNYSGFTNFLANSGLKNLAPGEEHEQIIDIKNVGTIDGKATIKFDTTNWNALGDNLKFTVYYDKDGGNDNYTYVTSGLLSAWNRNTYNLGDLNADSVGNVKIEWSVPTTAGNNIQGQSIDLNTTFGLEQVH